MISKLKLYPIESLLIAVIVVYMATIGCFYVYGSFDLDLEIKIFVDGLINPFILISILALVLVVLQKTPIADILSEKAPRVRGYLNKGSILLIAINVSVIVIYVFHGSFWIDIPIATINVPDPEKPYLALFIAVTGLLTLVFYRMAPPDAPLDEAAKTSFATSGLTSLALVIIALGGLLRVWGLSQGIEDNALHPDAPKQLAAIRNYLNGNYLFDLDYYGNRFISGYPYFGMHIIEMALRVVSLTGYDTFSNTDIIIAYRWLNVAYSCLMMALVYKIGALLGYKRAGLLAAVLLASSTTQNHMCKYLGADIAMSFFALLAVYVATIILKWERNRYYLVFGAMTGLSAACKYNGVLIFFVLGFVFLTLHPRVSDFLRNAPRLIMSVLVSMLVFVFANANILSSPVTAMKAIHASMTLTSNYWVKDTSFSGKLLSLMNIDYNLFVIGGLFQPLPLWLAILGLLVLVYRYPRKLAYLWAAPLVIFVSGKMSMPVSASHHFLNIVPLLLLAVAVGLDELASRVGKKFRVILPAILFIYVGYHAVQDNSLWLIKLVNVQNNVWLAENISPTDEARRSIKYIQSYEVKTGDGDNNRRIRHFYNATNRQAVSLHRDSHAEINIDSKNEPLIYPPVHFLDRDIRNIIYPASHDLVTTEKAFFTGNINEYKPAVTKFVMDEKPLATIAVWIKNISDKKNRVLLRVGSKNYKYKLEPFEEASLTIVNDPSRTFLYYGSFIKIDAQSEGMAGWRIAVNERDMGDMYLALGKTDLAVDAYLKSGDLYSGMQAFVNTGSREKRAEAVKRIKALKPDLFENDYIVSDENFWESFAGYTDKMFRSVMTRRVEYDLRFTKNARKIERHLEEGGVQTTWEIDDGGKLFGPYIPLMGGRYKVSADIMAKGDLSSFVFDVISNYGKKSIRSWRLEGDQLPSGSSYKKVTFEFEIKTPLEFPVEFRFHQVESGALLIKNVEITADYLNQTRRLLTKTREVANEAAHDPSF